MTQMYSIHNFDMKKETTYANRVLKKLHTKIVSFKTSQLWNQFGNELKQFHVV